MNRDEQAIQSPAANDLSRVLELKAEHVVLLVAGRPPMRGRNAFAGPTQH